MAERTIQHTARELAGQFYELTRTAESRNEKVHMQRRGRALLTIDPWVFGKTFPTVKDYLAGRRHGRTARTPEGVVYHVDDGSITQETPGWMHWYDQARQMLVATLANPGTLENIKNGIMAALIEDREKQQRQEANSRLSPNITQRHGFEAKH